MVLIWQFSFAVWIGCYMEVFAKALWQNWWEAHHRVKHKYVCEASSFCWRLIFKQASTILKSKCVKLLLSVACWRYFIWPICAGMYASGGQCSILLSINGGICRHMSFVLINKAFPYVGWACSCTWWNSSMLHTPSSTHDLNEVFFSLVQVTQSEVWYYISCLPVFLLILANVQCK
jgi:hypothetical protein